MVLGSDRNIDTVTVRFVRESPSLLTIAIPTGADGRSIANHFGEAPFLTFVTYDRQAKTAGDFMTETNPFASETKRRGIKVAEYIVHKGIESVCVKEDLNGKAPGLFFLNSGVEIRRTEESALESLIADYHGRSHIMGVAAA